MPLPVSRFPERAAQGPSPVAPQDAAPEPGTPTDPPSGVPGSRGTSGGAAPGPAPARLPARQAGPGLASPPLPSRPPRCRCGHGWASHDIRARDKARTACFVLLGPDGHRCGCKRYEAGESG
jgi:hypothetical protein